MTEMEIFYYLVLPASLVLAGWIAVRLNKRHVTREEWQRAEIQAGLDEADRGEFASEDEVASVIAKYVKTAESQ